MKFDHPEHELTYELPDDPTIRQLLDYDDYELNPRSSLYPRLWKAAQAVITEWECDALPLHTNIDEVGSEEQLKIIKLVSLEVFTWRDQLKEGRIPKN